ncbi:MAG: glycosyltransferase [Flavobacteriales bacterium]|nr:glycosyltransferase [Flavobacteriales bacterium]
MTGGTRAQGKSRERSPGRPLVSIVTVVYNGAATLERTIKSVLEQDYPNIEYIVVDGGSTDGTVDLLKSYDDRIDHWVSEGDKGIYDAMNKGVALCTGDWIALINADDWYEPNSVRRVIEAVQAQPHANIVHGDIWIHYEGGGRKMKYAKRNGFLLKYWEMVLNHPSFFVRRSFYRDRPFRTDLKIGGDHHWTLRAWLEDPDGFLYLPGALANFSAGGASMTIPLKKTLDERRKLSAAVGMNAFGSAVAQCVTIALHVPKLLKLWFNRSVSSSPTQ